MYLFFKVDEPAGQKKPEAAAGSRAEDQAASPHKVGAIPVQTRDVHPDSSPHKVGIIPVMWIQIRFVRCGSHNVSCRAGLFFLPARFFLPALNPVPASIKKLGLNYF